MPMVNRNTTMLRRTSLVVLVDVQDIDSAYVAQVKQQLSFTGYCVADVTDMKVTYDHIFRHILDRDVAIIVGRFTPDMVCWVKLRYRGYYMLMSSSSNLPVTHTPTPDEILFVRSRELESLPDRIHQLKRMADTKLTFPTTHRASFDVVHNEHGSWFNELLRSCPDVDEFCNRLISIRRSI